MCKKIIAITGPSGAGKTTITQKIFNDYGFIIPRHTTTRAQRCDDIIGFYRYITLEQFNKYEKEDKFLIASSDNIKGYGVLKSDCEDAWCFSDTIILNVSYKDIQQLKLLPYEVKIVVLTFKDIIQGIMSRIAVSTNRLHSPEDIDYRIRSAQKDFSEYFPALEKYATAIVYTDIMNESETYNFVKEKLRLDHNCLSVDAQCKKNNEDMNEIAKIEMEDILNFE